MYVSEKTVLQEKCKRKIITHSNVLDDFYTITHFKNITCE